MQQQYERDCQGIRAILLQEERDRRDPRRRNLFWDADRWAHLLSECIGAESTRDQWLHQRITSLPSGDARQQRWTHELYNDLDRDVEWYRWFLDDLKALRQTWETDTTVSQEQMAELVAHEILVEHRLHERQVQLHQIAIEYLERQRSSAGRLQVNQWTMHWRYLQQAWYSQDLFCQRAYDVLLPKAVCAARLSWCQYLRALQKATRQSWKRNRLFDRRGFNADAALLQKAIIKYGSRGRQVSRSTARLLSVGAVTLVVLVLWMSGAITGGGQLSATDQLPRSTQEARALTGEFSAQPPVQTAMVATPVSQSTTQMPVVATQGTLTAPMTAEQMASRDQSEDLNNAALALMLKGNCEDAVPLFKAAIQADQLFYEPPNNLAFCLFDDGDIDGAIRYWTRSIELKADNADGYAALATVLYMTGQYEAAKQSYHTALEIKPQYNDEHWLHSTALWSHHIIKASAPIRESLRKEQ